jgi:hypothetical protein
VTVPGRTASYAENEDRHRPPSQSVVVNAVMTVNAMTLWHDQSRSVTNRRQASVMHYQDASLYLRHVICVTSVS